mgnify:CR=1 FL=1
MCPCCNTKPTYDIPMTLVEHSASALLGHPQVLQQRGDVDTKEWRFLLAGPAAGTAVAHARRGSAAGGACEQPPNPGAGWLVEPPPFDLATCFREIGPATPLVFVLSPGE